MTNFSDNNKYSNNNENKEVLIKEVTRQFSSTVARHASEEDDEKKWLLEHCNSPVKLEILQEISVIGLHVLDAIGRFEPVNSITISKETAIPKGTVSKTIKKLISKKLIVKKPLPNNKKESIFHITPLGKELFELHDALHKQMDSAINNFLKKYDDDELQFLIRFLRDFQELTWSSEESEKK
ncbi:MarR family transcriptional regulator [Clostridium sp. YIM B02505]|uniref:MarR family transcriptional regulator n=1 Tax=Clostridium yunnanense TaxID=2800325 RepID=A0ABS1ETW6_9CLOT|nr:MarR family transcriptional regulator [Clostridium yunnanense]MBK1812829.1 MarR family transcriptional regulator [Clostridium yunnanense]